MRARFVPLVLLLVISGCATTPPRVPSPPPGPVPERPAVGAWTRMGAGTERSQLNPAHRVRMDVREDGGLLLGVLGSGTLEFGGHRVIVGDRDKTVILALDAAGAVEWTQALDGVLTSLAATPDGGALVGRSDGHLVLERYEPSGALRWRVQPAAESRVHWSEVYDADLSPEGDVIWAGYFRGRLVLPGLPALETTPKAYQGFVARADGDTGAVTWLLPVQAPHSNISIVRAREDGELIVAGSIEGRGTFGDVEFSGPAPRSGFVARIRGDGQVSFVRTLALEQRSAFLGAQRLSGEQIVLRSSDGGLTSVSERDGTIRWQRPLGGTRDLPTALVKTASSADRLWVAVHADPLLGSHWGSQRFDLAELSPLDGSVLSRREVRATQLAWTDVGAFARMRDGSLVAAISHRELAFNAWGPSLGLLTLTSSHGDPVEVDALPASGRPLRVACEHDLGPALSLQAAEWKLRTLTRRCEATSGSLRLHYAPDGSVRSVEPATECVEQFARTVRVCPSPAGWIREVTFPDRR